MNILHKTIMIEPPSDNIQQVVLNYYPKKGWLLGIQKGEDAFGMMNYCVTKNYTIVGGFIAISMLRDGSIMLDDYMQPEMDEISFLKWLDNQPLGWWDDIIKNPVVEHPILMQFKNNVK